MPQPAVRNIWDARTLRAMAHPLRLRILDAVALAGSATATEIAERVGVSPAGDVDQAWPPGSRRFIAWGVPARPPEPATADDG